MSKGIETNPHDNESLFKAKVEARARVFGREGLLGLTGGWCRIKTPGDFGLKVEGCGGIEVAKSCINIRRRIK